MSSTAEVFSPQTTCDCTIDVSHWQGKEIDWAKVAQAGKRVVMIKATEGLGTDDAWHLNRHGAEASGLVVIPYLFVSHEMPKRQVDYFVAATRLASGGLAAIDWEGNGASPAAIVEAVGDGLAQVTGRAPLGYWGLFPPGKPTKRMASWPRWIPRYGVNNGKPDHFHPVTTPWLFWQYTSRAKVNGIPAPVDASLFAGTESQLLDWCGTGTLPTA